MALKAFLTLSYLTALASAHFTVSYPEPRGVFNEDAQTEFCDGYTNAASNRSDFPLSNGLIRLNNSHTEWSAAILISIEQNPSSFSDFNTSSSGIELPLAVDWFTETGSGEICIPVDVASLNIEGVSDGSNITLQAMFTGGHGNLYQCVDVTLRTNATVPSNVTCSRTVNGTVDTAESSTDTSGSEDEDSGAQRLTIAASGLLSVAVAFLLL